MGKQVEFAAEEEDSGAVVLEAAEAAGVGFDRLNLGVETFGEGVGDRMLEVGQQMHQVSLEGTCKLLHRFEFAAHDCPLPLSEESLAGGGIWLRPELDHLLLVAPGPRGFQVHLQQFGKAGPMLFWHRAVQPPPAGPLDAWRPRSWRPCPSPPLRL